jgi:hypothetical protein
MSLPSPFATLQQAALKELPKFTGEPDQKVTQFIDAVDHIGIFAEWDDAKLHTLAIIKFGGVALNWYNNNKDVLRTWSILKTHLVERFQPSRSYMKTQLKTRHQQPGESLSTFHDDIVELCKQVDKDMPPYMIVDYLQDGVRDDLKIHIKRRMASITEVVTPATFLKIARTEEELQNETSFTPTSSSHSQPYFAPVAVATRSPITTNNRSSAPDDSLNKRDRTTSSRHNPSRSSNSGQSKSDRPYRPCLICNRSNHRTIDCYHKQATGCFKCGDRTHAVRDCSQVFQ